MKINKALIIVGMLIAFGLFFELAAHADENNQETTITFSAPVQIPGQVLSAGTYTFELANPFNLNRLVSASRTVAKPPGLSPPARQRLVQYST